MSETEVKIPVEKVMDSIAKEWLPGQHRMAFHEPVTVFLNELDVHPEGSGGRVVLVESRLRRAHETLRRYVAEHGLRWDEGEVQVFRFVRAQATDRDALVAQMTWEQQ